MDLIKVSAKNAVALLSSDFSTKLGIAGMSNTFEIKSKYGKATGYFKDSDFPNERSKEDRAEVFYVEVSPAYQKRGKGLDLMKEALKLVKSKGAKTVNMNGTTKAGRALIASAVRNNLLKQLRTSETGKTEFKIL